MCGTCMCGESEYSVWLCGCVGVCGCVVSIVCMCECVVKVSTVCVCECGEYSVHSM